MKAPFPGGDTQPWYRQFWPWFLILLPATVVVASLYTMYLASSGADDLVVDEYYKDGLAINRKLEKKDRASELGISATLRVEGQDVIVLTSGPVHDSRLQLQLSHPLESNRDFNVALMQSIPGEYRGRLSAEIAPRWHWALLSEGEQPWRLDGSVTASDLSANRGG